MKVLVTGASGFVGRALIAELPQNEFDVTTTGRKLIENLPNYFRAEITSAASLEKHLDALRGTEAIVHSAGLAHQFGAQDEKAFYQVNVEGTRHVAALAAKLEVRHFVLISSVAVYGRRGKIPVDESVLPTPQGIYAQTKFLAEQTAREICERSNIKLTILRLATVYGEGDAGNINRLINLLDKNRFVWIGEGRNLKSLIYHRDAARAVCLVLGNPQNGVYNVVGQTIEMRRIVKSLALALGKRGPFLMVPKSWPLAAGRFAALLSGHNSRVLRWRETLEKWLSDDAFSGAKFSREFNFAAQTEIEQGLRREVACYQKQKEKP